MTWPPLRPSLGWQQPPTPHSFVAFVTNRVHGSTRLRVYYVNVRPTPLPGVEPDADQRFRASKDLKAAI